MQFCACGMTWQCIQTSTIQGRQANFHQLDPCSIFWPIATKEESNTFTLPHLQVLHSRRGAVFLFFFAACLVGNSRNSISPTMQGGRRGSRLSSCTYDKAECQECTSTHTHTHTHARRKKSVEPDENARACVKARLRHEDKLDSVQTALIVLIAPPLSDDVL